MGYTIGNDALLDSGNISQEEYNERFEFLSPSEREVSDILNKFCFLEDGSLNHNVVHTIPYKDYMIAQPNPEHLFDNETMMEAVYGSQFRNLIISDISPDAIFKIHGKEYNKEELLTLYRNLITENLLDDFNKVQKRFNSIEDLQRALLAVAQGNPKYSKNVLDSLQLIDYTDPNTGETKKVFNIPLYSPTIANQVQEIVNAMFKNAVTKQHIKGAACVLVSNFGFTKELNIIYNKEGDVTSGVKYAECYLPWYSKKYFEPFMKTVTKDGVTYQELDIKRVPKELLEMIGYRIPTENKYSMIPLRVVGFLPQQNGSSIMLPADITTIAGSNFEIDRLFMMMPEYNIISYYREQAYEDYKKINTDSAVNNLSAAIFDSDVPCEEVNNDDFQKWWTKNKENYELKKPLIRKVRYNTKKAPQEQSRAARNNMLIDISRAILQHSDTTDKFLSPGSFDKIKEVEKLTTILRNKTYLRTYAEIKGIEIKNILSDDLVQTDYDTQEAFEAASIQRRAAVKKELDAVRKALSEETLDSLNDFLSVYKEERDPLSLDTFSYNHRQNMTSGILIGIYSNNTTMQAKFQGSGLQLRIVPANKEKGFKGINNTFFIDGHEINKLDAITSPWGERISKNCAEFLAASLDNVKDPVLAGLLQNTNTAKITCFMLRAGIPIKIIGLLFNQPIIKECIEHTGGLAYKDLVERLDRKYILDRSIPYYISSNDLIDTIILNDYKNSTAQTIAALMLHIQGCASDLSKLTQVCRADSPNGAIAFTLSGARNQVEKVTNLRNMSELNNFRISGVNCALMQNNKLHASDSIDEMRDKLTKAKLPLLQGFYSLGIELPLQVMSPYFIQLNDNLDKTLQFVYSQTPYGSLPDKSVEQFYRDFIEFMLTKSTLFGNDSNHTYDEKRDYYLYEFPEQFYYKKRNAKFEEFNIIKRMRIKNGVVMLPRSGRLTADMKESYVTDFDSMISSEDPEVVQMAIDLFMYTFYKDGYYFGPNSYGNFFSPFFLQCIPEFMRGLRDIESEVGKMNMDNFIAQFYNNHWKELTFELKQRTDALGMEIVKYENVIDPTSNIIVPMMHVVNHLTGTERTQYSLLQFEGSFYKVEKICDSVVTYKYIQTLTDEQAKKYNYHETIAEISDKALLN